jgi:hypothetical protein
VDRDLVLAGLLIITVTVTLLAAAPWPTPIRSKRSARQWELAAWRTLWWPSVPVVAVTSVLLAGVVAGIRFGDGFVQTLVKWL